MESNKESGGHGVAISIAAVVLIYVFFPIVFALPLEWMRRKGPAPLYKDAANLFFWPLLKLDESCPPYSKPLKIESDWGEAILPAER